MKTFSIKIPVAIAAFLLLLTACRVAKPYNQLPIKSDSLYRNVFTTDTTTIAKISWTAMFKDPNLQTLLQQSITNNYDLLAYDKQLTITLETVQNHRQGVEANKALKIANQLYENAVAQSEANRYIAEVTIPDLQNNIRQTENAISILIGKEPNATIRDSIKTAQVDTSLQTGISAQLLANHPDVQQAELSVRYYFEQINVARTYFYPTLTITTQGSWQTTSLSNFFNTAGLFRNVVAGLSQPIFNKGLNK